MAEDPYLGAKRNQLVVEAATQLANARMITFDRLSGSFTILDLGRIAAKYYIRHASIEIFNKELKPEMTEADVLKMLCLSTEVTGSRERAGTSLRISVVRSNTSPRERGERAQTTSGEPRYRSLRSPGELVLSSLSTSCLHASWP